jgi:DNA-binding PadR family transcriptional regulator
MSKYKYYFRQPKSEIVKDILRLLAIAGAIYIAASSPYFISDLRKNIKRWQKYKRKKFYNAFYRLQKEGCIDVREKNRQIYIALTEKGKRKAGRLQIDAMEIKKPKKWDGKWRILIFDISQFKKFYREALRGKLKNLGFRQLQKSVWIHPYDCQDEINVLKDFFGLKEKEMRLILAEDIGDEGFFKRIFKLK